MKPYYECSEGVLYYGDCLDIMPLLNEKVDLILTDPPYGTTACSWDSVIPFEDMWKCIKALRKEKTAVVLFGSEPFSSLLRCSNLKEFKYDWIWEKQQGANFMNVKYQPQKVHEIASVFYSHNYYPQKTFGNENYKSGKGKSGKGKSGEITKNIEKTQTFCTDGSRHPRSIQFFSFDKTSSLHPTQKPTKLISYLIKTYSNKNDTVIDFTCGSGTTAVSAIHTGRKFIMIEKEKKYCDIAVQRIEYALHETSMLRLIP